MKRINGFTLIEMLFVLTILSLLSVLVVPSMYALIEKQEINNFFNVLDADVLYIQNETLKDYNNNGRITFEANRYVVRITSKGDEIIRYYPDGLTYTLNNNRVRYHRNGTLLTPATHRFQHKHHTYKLVFPFGKGRHYIEKQ